MSRVRLTRIRQVDGARRGHDVFTAVMETQCSALDGADCKSLVAVAWECLGDVGGVHQFHVAQFGQAP